MHALTSFIASDGRNFLRPEVSLRYHSDAIMFTIRKLILFALHVTRGILDLYRGEGTLADSRVSGGILEDIPSVDTFDNFGKCVSTLPGSAIRCLNFGLQSCASPASQPLRGSTGIVNDAVQDGPQLHSAAPLYSAE